MTRRVYSALLLLCLSAGLTIAAPQRARAAGSDVVIYASDVANVQGNWSKVSDSTAAGAQRMTSADQGWSATASALAAPADYFEATFSAPASTLYHVWLRLRAGGNSKWNDSVYVQFSDATDQSGLAAYRIGSTAGLMVNLATDASGGSISGWGWQDRAYWTGQSPLVQFIGGGTHTVRVQTREDGVQVDQIVLSPATYLSSAPGAVTTDSTIVAKGAAPGGSTGSLTPFSGSPAVMPGTIEAENFDNGGEGVAYHDTTSGNSGGQYRATDVDIEAASENGYDVGWTAAAEWLNYTVNVSSAGSYTVQLRVASIAGGTLHVGFNGGAGASSSVSVPATGGWQSWRTVSVPMTLGAGVQQITVTFDTGGVNLNWMAVTGSSGSSSGSGSSSSAALTPYSGSPAAVPGTIEAENFDNGGEGVAYHDTTSGNSGGQYRSTDVDLEASSEGGYDVGWTAPGEWLNYTVSVASAGSYTVQLRVASPGGGSLRVGFNGASNVWSAVPVGATGGWQSWTTINVPVTLGAGTQQLTLLFDTGGLNVNWIGVVAGGSTSGSGSSGSSGGSGSAGSSGSSGSSTTLNVATWNIQIDDSSDTHARVAMDALMAINPRPQVVVIEEAYSNLFSTYIDELQRQTGQTWHGAFATHCAPGDWNGSSCSTPWYQGVGIFSTYNISSSSSMLFPYWDCWTSARVGLRAALDVNGTPLQVFATHLQTGGCTNDAQSRYNSMGQLKSWASNFSSPQIAAGDFNADPDQIDTPAGMSPSFIDTWSLAGSGSGYTAFSGSPTMKIDYWFEDSGGRAAVQSTAVVASTGSISDHRPVRATFQVR